MSLSFSFACAAQTIYRACVLAGALLLSLSNYAVAKPISYVGGTMVMVENDDTGHTLNVDYTFSPRMAGALYVKREAYGDTYTVLGPQLNALIKRWNMPDMTQRSRSCWQPVV